MTYLFRLLPGWTRARVMEQIRKFNNGFRACHSAGHCQYRTASGNRCAVGAFIPDNHPSLWYAGNAGALLRDYSDLWQYMPFDDTSALLKMQKVHDECAGSTYVALQDWLDTFVAEPDEEFGG